MESLSNYQKEERPWGFFERFTLNEPTTVKLITVKEGEAFSLQTHERREEYWRVLEGTGTVTVGSQTQQAQPGAEFFVPRGTTHRIEGGQGGVRILEIAMGEFDEHDITRLEDRYGRT
jgi:mannose-6-phosphate isomerase-like protein (cupin superfamily)